LTTRNHVRRIAFLLFFGCLLPSALLAQEELIFVAEMDTVAYIGRDENELIIHAGEMISTTAAVTHGEIRGNSIEHHLVIRFGEPNNRFWTFAKHFRPANTEDVFGEDIFIDHPMDTWDDDLEIFTVGDADRMWVPASFLNVLMGLNRDALLDIFPSIAHLERRFPGGLVLQWHEDQHADIRYGRAMFYNSAIMLGEGNRFAVRNIRRTDFGYAVDAVVSTLDWRESDLWFLSGGAFWSAYGPGNAVTLLLRFDGDYLEIYTDGSGIHVGSFARVGREFIAQYQSLIRTNAADLTNVQWPRRADGSMSAKLPPGIAPEPEIAAAPEEPPPPAAEAMPEIQPAPVAEAQSRENEVPLRALLAIAGGAVAVVGGLAALLARKKDSASHRSS